MGRPKTQLAGAGPAADPFTCTACVGRGWTGYDDAGHVVTCARCDGLGRCRPSGESWGDSPEPDLAPGGLLDAPACGYVLAEVAGETLDVALTLDELGRRLAEDWPETKGDIACWRIDAGACPEPRLVAMAYGTPSGLRWLYF